MSKTKPTAPIPDPPLLVLAKISGTSIVRWLCSVPFGPSDVRFVTLGGHGWYKPNELKAVPHDRNDAEAVAIIEGAKA